MLEKDKYISSTAYVYIILWSILPRLFRPYRQCCKIYRILYLVAVYSVGCRLCVHCLTHVSHHYHVQCCMLCRVIFNCVIRSRDCNGRSFQGGLCFASYLTFKSSVSWQGAVTIHKVGWFHAWHCVSVSRLIRISQLYVMSFSDTMTGYIDM